MALTPEEKAERQRAASRAYYWRNLEKCRASNARRMRGKKRILKPRRVALTLDDIRARCEINERGCWIWQCSLSDNGYGFIRNDDNKLERAHRVAKQLSGVDVPVGSVVRHDCDTPACCNPAHLQVGTQGDNCKDRDDKGRHVALKGEDHARAKLTEELVLAMRSGEMSPQEAAAISGVHVSTAYRALDGTNWRHI